MPIVSKITPEPIDWGSYYKLNINAPLFKDAVVRPVKIADRWRDEAAFKRLHRRIQKKEGKMQRRLRANHNEIEWLKANRDAWRDSYEDEVSSSFFWRCFFWLTWLGIAAYAAYRWWF